MCPQHFGFSFQSNYSSGFKLSNKFKRSIFSGGKLHNWKTTLASSLEQLCALKSKHFIVGPGMVTHTRGQRQRVCEPEVSQAAWRTHQDELQPRHSTGTHLFQAQTSRLQHPHYIPLVLICPPQFLWVLTLTDRRPPPCDVLLFQFMPGDGIWILTFASRG